MTKSKAYYTYNPVHERTRTTYDQIYARFQFLKRHEFETDPRRARYLSDLYYIDLIADEFLLSATHVRKIINSRRAR